jgi:hypothetical protein
MKKAGKPRGFQNFQCGQCKTYYLDGARIAQKRPRRRYLASIRWESVIEAINRAALQVLSPELRREFIQEMAARVLDGEIDIKEIESSAAHYRRVILSQNVDRFRFVSLDQAMPGNERMTYGERLAG